MPPKVAPIQIYLGKEEVKKAVMKMPRSEEQTRRCCCSCCITSPAVHRRVTANLDRGEQALLQCPCSLRWGTCHIIYLIIWLFFFFPPQLLISLVRHRDTLRPTGLITLNSYFLKCNIYRYPGTCTPRVLLHITDFFLFCILQKWRAGRPEFVVWRLI